MAALALAAVAALALPSASAARIVSHESTGASPGLGGKAIERAAARSILRAPTGAADPYPTASATPSTGDSGSIAGLPPTTPTSPTAQPSASTPAATAAAPFRSNAVADPTAYPNSASGKLFGRIKEVGSYACSASVVRTRNRSVILTAGHCVKDPGRGGWASDLTFIPAYTDGARPFGRWDWEVIYTSSQWAKRGNTNFDYAAVVLGRSKGRRIANVTGSLGFAYGVRRDRRYRAVGYPSNKSDGQLMWECVSDFRGGDPFYRAPGPVPIGIGCDMVSGASGGGWTIAGNRLASLTSFGFAERPNLLYGPRFTQRTDRLRRKAGRQ